VDVASLRVPLIVLVIPPVCTCVEGSGFHTAYNRLALPAYAVWRHQLIAYKSEYRQALQPRNV